MHLFWEKGLLHEDPAMPAVYFREKGSLGGFKHEFFSIETKK